MAHGRILFISDLHLDASAPATIEQFLSFLRTEAINSDALYILGDLFESWIGDDDIEPARIRIREALRALTSGGVPCFIQHGNRDFLLGSAFMATTGCQLLPDPALLVLGDQRIVLTHGDQLCTDDHQYQRFRRLVRRTAAQRVWLAFPLGLRRRLAAAARLHSRAHTRQLPAAIMDVTPTAVTDLLRSTQGDVLVHGHTHRPDMHFIEVDGHRRRRFVLGDWPDQASVLVVDAMGQLSVRAVPASPCS